MGLVIATTSSCYAFPAYGGQKTAVIEGMFKEFLNGNKNGGITIEINGKEETLRTSRGMTFDGIKIPCSSNPTPIEPCAQWPNDIKIGSKVRVIYWKQESEDSPYKYVAKDVSAI